MKVLIDMNLSPSWTTYLSERGHEAIHWSQVGDPRAPDRALLDWARASGYVVFTNDLDFGVLLAIAGATGPSVFQVRALDLTPDRFGPAVVRVLDEHADVLTQGALVTLDEHAARVRILPIQRTSSAGR